MGGVTFSVVWYQPIWLMPVDVKEGGSVVGHQCCFEERCSGKEKF